jgi:hypothetical protein
MIHSCNLQRKKWELSVVRSLILPLYWNCRQTCLAWVELEFAPRAEMLCSLNKADIHAHTLAKLTHITDSRVTILLVTLPSEKRSSLSMRAVYRITTRLWSLVITESRGIWKFVRLEQLSSHHAYQYCDIMLYIMSHVFMIARQNLLLHRVYLKQFGQTSGVSYPQQYKEKRLCQYMSADS